MDEKNINLPKKRGRKPKNFFDNKLLINNNKEEICNSEDDKVIYHLPLNPNDIHDLNNLNENDLNNKTNNIFIKNIDNNTKTDDDTTNTYDQINSTIVNNNINKIQIHQINISKNTKCWWCKNNFNSHPVQLPENYTDGIFYCIGHFCSYNCAKSYNLDLNDISTFKRNSLINFLYYLTYSVYLKIIPAAHWLTLEEYGGLLSIKKFRENFIINNSDFLVLHPPLISRQVQIEESYKINKLKEVSINKLNKIYSDIDSEYTIKRNKSYQNNNISLEETMGFIKI